jgi:hypothetical protein
MKTFAAFSCFLMCLLVLGCKGGSNDVVGKWKGAAEIPAGQADDAAAKMAKQMLGDISLELKADKTFVMTMMFPFEGTWTQSGSSVTMTVTKMMGKEAKGSEKPLVLTVSSDGQTMTAADMGAGKGTIKFVREK